MKARGPGEVDRLRPRPGTSWIEDPNWRGPPPTLRGTMPFVNPRSGITVHDALLPSAASRVRLRKRPWADPVCGVMFVTGTVFFFVMTLIVIAESAHATAFCVADVSGDESQFGVALLDGYVEVFTYGKTGIVWGTFLCTLIFGAIWFISLSIAMYGTMLLAFTLQVLLTVLYSEFDLVIPAVSSAVIAVFILLFFIMLQQKIHIASKAMLEAASIAQAHMSLFLVMFVYLVLDLALISYIAYCFMATWSVRSAVDCKAPGPWIWFSRVYILVMGFWMRGTLQAVRSFFTAGTVSLSFFHEGEEHLLPMHPVLLSLKWANTRSLGAAALAGAVTNIPFRLLSGCYCCCCCCGVCARRRGVYELDGMELHWSRGQQGTSRTWACLESVDWIRTMALLTSMVQAYQAITGLGAETSARHVHSILQHQRMWAWATTVFRVCRSLVYMLVSVVVLFVGSVTTLVAAYYSDETTFRNAVADGIAYGSTGMTITLIVMIYYAKLLVISVGTVLLAYILDRTHQRLWNLTAKQGTNETARARDSAAARVAAGPQWGSAVVRHYLKQAAAQERAGMVELGVSVPGGTGTAAGVGAAAGDLPPAGGAAGYGTGAGHGAGRRAAVGTAAAMPPSLGAPTRVGEFEHGHAGFGMAPINLGPGVGEDEVLYLVPTAAVHDHRTYNDPHKQASFKATRGRRSKIGL